MKGFSDFIDALVGAVAMTAAWGHFDGVGSRAMAVLAAVLATILWLIVGLWVCVAVILVAEESGGEK